MRLVAPAGKVLVIEPDPYSFRELLDFVRKYNLQDVCVPVNKGVWKESGVLTFLVSRDHPASGQLLTVAEARGEKTDPSTEKIDVPVDTLKAICEEHDFPNPQLLSITTNGAELNILEGSRSWLDGYSGYVSLALTGQGYEAAMNKYGYSVEALDDRGILFSRSDSV